MFPKTKLSLLLLLGLGCQGLFGQRTLSHDHYWSVRPLNWLYANPNIQFGNRLPCKDSNNRIYNELSLTYPFGKTIVENFAELNAQIIALQIENSLRFVNRRNVFIAPVFEVDYRRFNMSNYLGNPTTIAKPDYNYLNLRLGFQNGKYFINYKKTVSAIYWGLALRYTIDLIDANKFNGIGSKEYYYWGLKFYLNWQIGGGYKAVYKRKY